MTIRTSLFPMGYRQTGSPQPTGDTPGNLLGLAYCYENYDDSDIEIINNYETIVVEVKEDVFRYNVDLSNYSGNADTVMIKLDWTNIDDENDRSKQLDSDTGAAIELVIKTRPDKDCGIAFDGVAMAYEITNMENPLRDKKNTTMVMEVIYHRLGLAARDIYIQRKTLEKANG